MMKMSNFIVKGNHAYIDSLGYYIRNQPSRIEMRWLHAHRYDHVGGHDGTTIDYTAMPGRDGWWNNWNRRTALLRRAIKGSSTALQAYRAMSVA